MREQRPFQQTFAPNDPAMNSPEEYSARGKQRRRSRRKSLWAYIAGGSALAVFGASRKNLAGAGLAALGGFFVYRGVRLEKSRGLELYVHQSFHINQPIEKLYSYWRNFENLPKFMRHLKSVRPFGSRFLHWEAAGPMNTSFSWDTEITDERENEYIVWRSLPGASIQNRGSIEFREASGHGGSEIHVSIQYDAPVGRLGAAFARIFGEYPEDRVRDDLRRFKQLMETGEIPTTVGQSSGRRDPWTRMIQAVERERKAAMVSEPREKLA